MLIFFLSQTLLALEDFLFVFVLIRHECRTFLCLAGTLWQIRIPNPRLMAGRDHMPGPYGTRWLPGPSCLDPMGPYVTLWWDIAVGFCSGGRLRRLGPYGTPSNCPCQVVRVKSSLSRCPCQVAPANLSLSKYPCQNIRQVIPI